MTNQEKKEYLSRYKLLDERINRKIEEVSRWHDKATKITASYSDMPKCKADDKLQNAIDMIVSLQGEITRDIDRLIDLKEDIDRIIERVEDDTLQLLLQYRYIDGNTFDEIAEQMNYSWRWILKLHERALQRLKIDHGSSYVKVLK